MPTGERRVRDRERERKERREGAKSENRGEKENEKERNEAARQSAAPASTIHHSIGMLTQIPTYTQTFNDFEFSLRVSALGVTTLSWALVTKSNQSSFALYACTQRMNTFPKSMYVLNHPVEWNMSNWLFCRLWLIHFHFSSKNVPIVNKLLDYALLSSSLP